MRLSLRQRRAAPEEPGLHGPVRVDPRTKNLTKRLRPGDVAVIDHLDIDRVSAEALAACRPVAVWMKCCSARRCAPSSVERRFRSSCFRLWPARTSGWPAALRAQ